MNAKYIPPMLVMAACLFEVALHANDIEPGKEYYTAIKAPNPIVLDGNLSEWSGAMLLADPRFSIPKGSGKGGGTLVFFEEHNGGVWTGPDDHTSAVQVVYDENNVYFGFIVTDDYHENSANSAWNGDSVQLMIANEARDQQIALYNYALGGIETALGEVIIMHEAGPAADPACDCATEAVIIRNTATKRTYYEIKLPKAALGLETLEGGVRFGLGMAINDGDEDTPGQRGWGGLGAHSIVFGKTPSETALVTLARSNDIEPGKEFYFANPSPNPVVVDGNLAEWTGVPVLSDPRFAVPKGSGRAGTLVLFEEHNGGVWTGPDDHTSAVQIVYDANNIYFGFVVTDDYHENSANSAWNGDSVQLMIANKNQDAQVALYNYALGGVEGALGEVIVMHEAGPAADPTCDCATEAVVTRNSATKRTIYEIKLPKAALGLDALELGTQFGLGMAINDGDQDTPGQRGWGGLGAHSIVFGKTPQQTALVTLGIGGTGGDLIFLSAINPHLEGFTFRANDKGASIVDPATARLIIDGQVVPLTAGPKNIDAIDFSYNRGSLFPPGSQHTYVIEIKDTNGNLVTESSTFRTAYYPVLRPSMKAVSVDTTKRGFLWRVFQHLDYTHTSLAKTEDALAGRLTDDTGAAVTRNDAEPTWAGAAIANGVRIGPVVQFEIATVINLFDGLNPNQGNFVPDLEMPGIFLDSPGIDAEIITFVDLPAGWITLGVNSDDGFRSQGGYINNPNDGVLLGEFDGGRGAADTTFRVLVEEAGVYPIRTIYNNGAGSGSIEMFSIAADGVTRVLLNDTANGGRITYRSGVAPEVPQEFSIGIAMTAGTVQITWTQAGLVLQESTNLKTWTNVPNATSPYRPVISGTTAKFYRLRQ